MFSAKLERQKRFHRLAILVAATVFATGVVLIAIWAVRASSMLTTADADRAPIIIGVLIALAGVFALCLLAYGAVRVFGRFPSL
jgi:multidrug resistance efflux pump